MASHLRYAPGAASSSAAAPHNALKVTNSGLGRPSVAHHASGAEPGPRQSSSLWSAPVRVSSGPAVSSVNLDRDRSRTDAGARGQGLQAARSRRAGPVLCFTISLDWTFAALASLIPASRHPLESPWVVGKTLALRGEREQERALPGCPPCVSTRRPSLLCASWSRLLDIWMRFLKWEPR